MFTQDDWTPGIHLFKTENYGSIPFAYFLEGNSYRIYFSQRDSKNRCYPVFIDCQVHGGKIELLGEVEKIPLLLGETGTFDDSGIMPSCVVNHEGDIYMYYIGWSPQSTVSYRLSIGLALSRDGRSFTKYSKGPILDRDQQDPFFVTAPYVIKEGSMFKMWYVSTTKWIYHRERTEPMYRVAYAESLDGIRWEKKQVCIDYDFERGVESIGRPCVFKNEESYELYFSHRGSTDYRENPEKTYKIGRAFSEDGKNWNQKDLRILQSQDWYSEMNEYSHVFKHKEHTYMLYNGNHFGKYGFGYATREQRKD